MPLNHISKETLFHSLKRDDLARKGDEAGVFYWAMGKDVAHNCELNRSLKARGKDVARGRAINRAATLENTPVLRVAIWMSIFRMEWCRCALPTTVWAVPYQKPIPRLPLLPREYA